MQPASYHQDENGSSSPSGRTRTRGRFVLPFLLLLISALFPALVPVRAERRNTEIRTLEVSGFEENTREATQEYSQWCWAASIQAVLAHYGVRRSQRDIVLATYGRLDNLPASSPEILYNALNNFRFSDQSTVEIVRSAYGPGSGLTARRLFEELSGGHPIIVWFRTGPSGGHSVVIYSADFMPNGYPVTVKYFDPWPGRGIREVSAQPFGSQIVAFFSVRAARLNSSDRNRATAEDDSTSDSSPPSRSIESKIQDCLAGMPERCIRTCVNSYGHSYSTCRYQLCRPDDPVNQSSWRRKCEREAAK